MSSKNIEEQVIRSYRQDEDMMILVFVQWCINHDLDPSALYAEAYPNQPANAAMQRALELTVPKEEAGDIPDQTVLSVLGLFGNDDLAFIVTEHISLRNKK